MRLNFYVHFLQVGATLDYSGVSGSLRFVGALWNTHIFLKGNTKAGLDYWELWRMILSVPRTQDFSLFGTHSNIFTLFLLHFHSSPFSIICAATDKHSGAVTILRSMFFMAVFCRASGCVFGCRCIWHTAKTPGGAGFGAPHGTGWQSV